MDRNVDVEKSNARSGNFPGEFESRMKSIDKLDESVIDVSAEKFWYWAIELVENLFLDIADEKICIIGAHFGAHGYSINLLIEFVVKREAIEGES